MSLANLWHVRTLERYRVEVDDETFETYTVLQLDHIAETLGLPDRVTYEGVVTVTEWVKSCILSAISHHCNDELLHPYGTMGTVGVLIVGRVLSWLSIGEFVNVKQFYGETHQDFIRRILKRTNQLMDGRAK